MAGERLSDEVLEEAESLLSEGMSYKDVADQIGVTPPTLYRRFPQFRKRKPDPTPGGGAQGADGRTTPKPKVNKPGITDDNLLEFYSKVAVAPSVPMLLLADCQFCAEHFTRTGPTAAAQLVTMSKENASLRSVLESGYTALTKGMWAGVLLMYAGVPIAHHLAPENVYNALAFFNVLPSRDEVDDFHESHAREEEDEEVGPTGFEGLDMDQLLRTAEGFGIRLDSDMVELAAKMFQETGDVINVEATDIEPSPEQEPERSESEQQAAAEAEDAAETVEGVEADSVGDLAFP